MPAFSTAIIMRWIEGGLTLYMKRNMKRKKTKTLIYLSLTVPALAFYIFAIIGPFLFGTIPASFRNWNIIKGVNAFIGFDNYVRLFTKDTAFIRSITFTAKLGLGSLVFVNSFALIVALMLERGKVIGRSIARSLFFLPNIISGIILAYTWLFMFNEFIPSLGRLLGISALESISWFSTPGMATAAMLIVDVWKSLGFQMVIFINGLQSIPADVLEAATIDRCSGLRMIWHIKLPLLMPSITLCLLLTIIGAFKSFDLSYALTQGGPASSTQTIAYNIYKEAFTNNRMGYACAKSMIMMAIIGIASAIQLKATRRKEVEM